ncbi:MAG: transglutaminase-like cysteine peptidase [Hyphomicrobiales bacterium]
MAALVFGFVILLQAFEPSLASTPSREGGTPDRAERGQPLLPSFPEVEFGVFGSIPLKATISPYAAKWTDLKERVERERETYAACERGDGACTPRVKAWQDSLASLRGRPQLEQIGMLNRRINSLIAYRDDQQAFGRKDHWATPLESLNGSGDCEDYAILKFYSLLQLGFSDGQIRLAIVRDTRRRLLHAVTTVEIDGRVYVMDNLFDDPVEHHHVLKYAPSFTGNLADQWVHIVTREIRARFVDQVERRLAGKHGDRQQAAGRGQQPPAQEYAVDPLALRAAWT